MIFTYDRVTGNFTVGTVQGARIGKCYAGNGAGLDNPLMEKAPNVGPLPAGWYTLKAMTAAEIAEAKEGPIVFKLIPDKTTEMYKRFDMRLHWDNIKQNFSASKGCIVSTTSQLFQRVHDGDRVLVL